MHFFVSLHPFSFDLQILARLFSCRAHFGLVSTLIKEQSQVTLSKCATIPSFLYRTVAFSKLCVWFGHSLNVGTSKRRFFHLHRHFACKHERPGECARFFYCCMHCADSQSPCACPKFLGVLWRLTWFQIAGRTIVFIRNCAHLADSHALVCATRSLYAANTTSLRLTAAGASERTPTCSVSPKCTTARLLCERREIQDPLNQHARSWS